MCFVLHFEQGGAVAQLLTISLLTSLNTSIHTKLKKRIHCVTFAAPSVATSVVATNLNHLWRSRFSNFVHGKDVVPKLMSWVQEILSSITTFVIDGAIASSKSVNCVQSVVGTVTTLRNTDTVRTRLTDAVTTGLGDRAGQFIRESAFVSSCCFKPVGKYYILEELVPGGAKALNSEGMQAFINYDSFEITALDAHSLTVSYGAYIECFCSGVVLRGCEGILSTESPAAVRLPPAAVESVEIYRVETKGQMMVKVIGEHLYNVKSISSLSHLYHCTLRDCIVASSNESGTCDSLLLKTDIDDSLRPAAISASDNNFHCDFETDNFFAWNRTEPHRNVPVHPMEHSLEDKSLQELMFITIHLLLFVKDNDHHAISDIKTIVSEILNTLPASQLLSYSNPFAHHIMRNGDLDKVFTLMYFSDQLDSFRKELKEVEGDVLPDYFSDFLVKAKVEDDAYAEAVKRGRPPQEDPVLRKWENGRRCGAATSVFRLLSETDCGGNDIVQTVVDIYSTQMREAVKMAKDANEGLLTSEEDHIKFMDVTILGMFESHGFTLPLGKYFNFDQTDLGNSATFFLALFRTDFVESLLSRATKTTATTAFLTYSGYVFYAVYIGYAIGGAAVLPLFVPIAASIAAAIASLSILHTVRSWPEKEKTSSRSLCLAFLDRMEVQYPKHASLSDRERLLTQELRKIHLWKLCSVERFGAVCRTIFPNRNNSDYINRRLKLTVLSSELRQALKRVPLVMLCGPTKCGKTALREQLRPNPNEESYGNDPKQRTSVPEIYVCEYAEGQTFCIMDCVGLGDCLEVNNADAVRLLNDIFMSFASAIIIVVSQELCSSSHPAYLTSCKRLGHHEGNEGKEEEKTMIEKLKTVFDKNANMNSTEKESAKSMLDQFQKRKPNYALTCITRSDGGIFDEDDGYKSEKFVDRLTDLACAELARGCPLDIRSIEEDPRTPRVWAAFLRPRMEAKKLPNELKGTFIHTSNEVREWIRSVFSEND